MKTFNDGLILSIAFILSACASHNSGSQDPTQNRLGTVTCEATVAQVKNLNGQSINTVIDVLAQNKAAAQDAATDAMAECLDQNLVIQCSGDICLIAERMKE
jgi:hypothetical protein